MLNEYQKSNKNFYHSQMISKVKKIELTLEKKKNMQSLQLNKI